jgi:hypothetical protein
MLRNPKQDSMGDCICDCTLSGAAVRVEVGGSGEMVPKIPY